MLASKAVALGTETPRGTLSLARQCQHRNTHGRQKHAEPAHGVEQCAGLAEGFEEGGVRERAPRQEGCRRHNQQCASATRELAGISSVNCGNYICTSKYELCDKSDTGSIFYLRYVIEALTGLNAWPRMEPPQCLQLLCSKAFCTLKAAKVSSPALTFSWSSSMEKASSSTRSSCPLEHVIEAMTDLFT